MKQLAQFEATFTESVGMGERKLRTKISPIG